MSLKSVWQGLLEQHDKLVKTVNCTLYDRVTLLKTVYEDTEYLADCTKQKRNPLEILNLKTSDTCANFTELLQILRLFPKRPQWESGNLSEMRMKMIEHLREQAAKQKGKTPKKAKPKQVRETATLAEVREKDERINLLQAENESLKAQLKQANQVIKALEDNLELSRETMGSLNETISLLKMQKTPKKPSRTV